MEPLVDTPRPEVTLRILRVVAPLAALTMAAMVVIGLAGAPQGAASELLDNIWGRITIVDLYLALGAVWAWIAWRERRAGRAALWAVLLVTTGSVAAWAYVAWRAHGVRDVAELLLGRTEIGT